MISSHVKKAIAESVVELIDLIQEEEFEGEHGEVLNRRNLPIGGISILPDRLNEGHWVVSATVGGYDYKYAIYINKETGQTETDGY